MTQDEKGKLLPTYLATLADHLTGEQEQLLNELDSLTKNIGHIKEIIRAQQAYAGRSGVLQRVSIPDMIEEALHMNASSIERYQIQLARDYADLGEIEADKHKLMQILVNLIRNAKDALVEAQLAVPQLTLRIALTETNKVRISVTDNGVGIAPENLTKIFEHGFTTKKHGHGFGLHSCALAAKEMGGCLTMHSDGPGKGATFTLELPMSSEEIPHA